MGSISLFSAAVFLHRKDFRSALISGHINSCDHRYFNLSQIPVGSTLRIFTFFIFPVDTYPPGF